MKVTSKHYRHAGFLLLSLCLGAEAADAPARNAETGMKIFGSDEAPAVLNIVPWQERELDAGPADQATPVRSVLDDALRPLDRAVVERENAYRAIINQPTK